MVLQVFQLLMLLIGIPLLQSLLSGCDRKISRSISHRQYPEHLILYSQKNPFRKTNNDFCVDSAEKSKILPSKSALFSSSTGRGRKKNFIPSDGISSDSPTRRNMRDVLTLSLTGCLLSIIITRDIWCAASSFLVLNVITSQQNLFGSFLRGFSRKFVTFSRGLTRKKMITNIIDFLKAVNEASVLNEPRSNLRSQMKIMERSKGSRNYTPFVTDDNNDAANIGKIDSLLGSTLKNVKGTSRIDHNRHIQTAVTSQIKGGINRTIFAEDDSDEELLPLSTEVPSPLTGKALSGIETETVPSIEVKVQEVCVHVDDKIVGHDFPPHLPIQPASVSDNVVIATIEVQAAADAASARLKAWLVQQRAIEDGKRKAKLSIIAEKKRIEDLPRQRLELLRHLAIFVSTIDCTDLAVTTFEDVIASEKYLQLGSFSSRAVETSTGSINDFVSVLTSPGKNTLKQRYRQLAKEFHPDSARNVDLSDYTVNSLMSNLTGAFNYLSGVNSLSTDGHTLMSVKSPWGMKYTGGTSFDPALAKKDLGESQKRQVHDSIASSKPSSKQVQKNEKSTEIESQIEGEVNIEKQKIEIVKFAIPDLKDSKSQVEVDFSTPYNSPEQEKKWRSWGKDIDWGKMKFQGGSEIYTRAQEGGIGGVGGGKSSLRTKDIETAEDRIINENVAHESGYKITNGVKGKDKGRESAKEKNILDAVPSSFPHHDKDKDRDEEITRSSGKRGNIVRTDAQQKKSIRAAYAVASGSDNEVCDASSPKAAVPVDIINEEGQKRERSLSQEAVTAVMFVKECSNIDSDIDIDRLIESGEDDESSGSLHTDRWKAPIRSPIAAQVLVPPMLSGEYYLWGSEVPPNTIPTVPKGEREKKDKSPSSFINCFKTTIPNVAATGVEKGEDRETGPQRMTSMYGSSFTPFSSFESESRTRSLAGSPPSSTSPGRHITPTGSNISSLSSQKDIRSTLDGISSPLSERGHPFTMSISSSCKSDKDISMMTAAERKAEGRDCVQWVEGVILKAKGNEIRERVEKSNKQRSFSHTEDTYRSDTTVRSTYGNTVVRGERISTSSSSSSSIYYNADSSSSSPAYSSRSFPMK